MRVAEGFLTAGAMEMAAFLLCQKQAVSMETSKQSHFWRDAWASCGVQ